MQVSESTALASILLIPSVVSALEQRETASGPVRRLFTIDELEWFSRNAYNLALKNTATWELRSIVRMLNACVNIISHFPSGIGSTVELSLKTLFSRFVIASALVSLARTQDNVEKQLHDYSAMRKHIAAFDNEFPEYLPQLDEPSRNDMVRKHAALLAFDFEAAIALKQWDDLGCIVQRAVSCKNITAFQAMADSLLRAKAPRQGMYPARTGTPSPFLILSCQSIVLHDAQNRQRDLGIGKLRRREASQVHPLSVSGHIAAGRRAGDEAAR